MACNCATAKQIENILNATDRVDLSKSENLGKKIRSIFIYYTSKATAFLISPFIIIYMFKRYFFNEGKISMREMYNYKDE